MTTIQLLNHKLALAIALGTNPIVQKDIEKLYQVAQTEYYKSLKVSELSKHPIIFTYPISKEESIKKALGIIEYHYQHQDITPVMRLIKKGFKVTWQYYERNKKINLIDFYQKYTKKEINEIDLMRQIMILYYLCIEQGKMFDLNNLLGEIFIEQINNIESIKKHQESIKKQLDTYAEEIKAIVKEQDFRLHKKETLDVYLDRQIQRASEAYAKQYPEMDTYQNRDFVFKNTNIKYIGAFSILIRMQGMNAEEFTNSFDLTKEVIEKTALMWILAQKNNRLTAQDKDMFIIATLFTQAIVSEYGKTKEEYLSSVKDTLFGEMQMAQEKQEENQMEIQRLEEQLKKERKKYELNIEMLQEENEQLKREVQRQEQARSKMENEQKELIALRELFFEMEQTEDEYVDSSEASVMEKYLETLRDYKLMVLGGRLDWQNKMKEKLPNCRFVAPDQLNIDLRFVDHLDAVFVQTSANKHAAYRRLMSVMNQNITPLHFLQDRTNIEKSLEDMYRKLNT